MDVMFLWFMVYDLMDLSFKLIWWIHDEECKKHEEEQIRMNRIQAEFENQWQMDTSIAGTPVTKREGES
jgi:hypothetical protein